MPSRLCESLFSAVTTRTLADIPRLNIPYPNSGIHATAHDSDPVEGNSVDLVMVSPEDMYALPSVDIPQSTGEVVAPASDAVTAYIQRSYTVFMALKDS